MFRANEYVKAESLEEAYQLNQKKSNVLLGGMMWLKMGSNYKSASIDLSGLGLDYIEEDEEEFRIGCMCSLRSLELHEGLNRYFGGIFRECTKGIVGVQFRNGATVGGSVFGRYGFSDILTCMMMLDVQVVRGGKIISQDLALNDAVVFKGSMARVAEVEVWADQVQVSSIMGDGVIVATPTGSTAYSMSAGGPIVEPTSRSIIITPVCAHQLAARAMVLSPERTVSVTLPRGTRKHLYLSVDGGKAIRLSGSDRVEVRRSTHCTKLVQLAGRSFYQVINQKLGGFTK